MIHFTYRFTYLSVIWTALVVTGSAAPAHQTENSAPSMAMSSMPLTAPLFLDGEDGFTSMVTVVNATAVQQSFDFLLTDRTGRETLRTLMTITPHSQKKIRLVSVLKAASLIQTSGSVQLIPHVKDPLDMPLAAQLSIERTRYYGFVDRLEEEFSMADMHASADYRATTTFSAGTSTLALRSVSDRVQQVRIACIKESGETTWDHVTNPPAALITTGVCDAEPHTKADENMGRRPQTMGVAVSTSNPGGLLIYGFAHTHIDGQEELMPLYFQNTALSFSSSFVFPGVPVGPTTLLPGSNYKTHLGLVNFGSVPVHASVIYASTQSGIAAPSSPVAQLVIPPWSARTVKLPELVGNSNLQNSFVVESDAPPGTLSATLRATSEGFPDMNLVPHEKVLPGNGGIHPWQIENGGSSVLLLFNPSTGTHKFTVSLYASGKEWVQIYSLAAYESTAVDIGKVVSDQVADRFGNRLPAHAKEGEVNWFDLNIDPGEGRLLQVNSDAGMARSFSCYTAYTVCNAKFQNSPMSMSTGSTSDNTFNALVCSVYEDTAPGQGGFKCSGNFGTPASGSPQYPATYNFFTSNTSVASAAGGVSGNAYATVTANSPGSTTLTGNVNDGYGCFAYGQTTVNVTAPQPNQLKVLSDTFGPQNCPAGTSATLRQIAYEIDDINGTPIRAPLSVYEQFTSKSPQNGTTTCNNSVVHTSESCTQLPSGSGGFIDGLSPGCASPSAPNTCGFVFGNQSWHYCQNGANKIIGHPGTLSVTKAAISVGGNTTGFAVGTVFKGP